MALGYIFFYLNCAPRFLAFFEQRALSLGICAGSAMFIARKLALQGIPIKRRGGLEKYSCNFYT
jgi:hypothetical protein